MSQQPKIVAPKVTLSSQLKNFAIGGASGMIATSFVSPIIPFLSFPRTVSLPPETKRTLGHQRGRRVLRCGTLFRCSAHTGRMYTCLCNYVFGSVSSSGNCVFYRC